MTHSNCAITTCRYNGNKSSDTSYHRFPKNKKLRATWIHACKRKDPGFSADKSRICSNHFCPEDFQRDLPNELLGLPLKKKLKAGAVPSLLLPGKKVNLGSEIRSNRRKKRERQCILAELLKGNYRNDSDMRQSMPQPSLEDQIRTLKAKLKEKDEAHKLGLARIQGEMDLLHNNVKYLKERINIQVEELAKLQQELASCKGQEKVVDNKYRVALSKVFTQTQISRLLNDGYLTQWKQVDIMNALSLYYLSSKAYKLLREKFKLPLPSISTINRWVQHVKCIPGIIHFSLNAMSAKAGSMSDQEKLTILSFAEMKVHGRVGNNRSKDNIICQHDKVQVVMVRGLLAKWKQPIFYDFDYNITAERLNNVISVLANIGFCVLVIVSDLRPSNRGLLKQLGITESNTSFPHPTKQGHRIWVVADTPHLIKLLRNHFIDDGFQLATGEVLTTAPLVELLNADKEESAVRRKISPNHLTLTGIERMHVAPALRVFSSTVAKALENHFENENDAQSLAKFIQLVDNFFDVMNSRSPNSKKPLNSGFGVCEDQQIEVLNNMTRVIRGMRCCGKKNLLPFQIGILITIKSTIDVYHHLKKLGIRYFLTSRISQDYLESLFSKLRGIGGFHDHPNPSDVSLRMKHLLVGAIGPTCAAANSVEDDDDDDGFITSELSMKLGVAHSDANMDPIEDIVTLQEHDYCAGLHSSEGISNLVEVEIVTS